MGRGAVVEFESSASDMVEILANDLPIARGHVLVNGLNIAIEIQELVKRPESIQRPGTAIGSLEGR
jgi:flagellar motor switch protein FliN